MNVAGDPECFFKQEIPGGQNHGAAGGLACKIKQFLQIYRILFLIDASDAMLFCFSRKL